MSADLGMHTVVLALCSVRVSMSSLSSQSCLRAGNLVAAQQLNVSVASRRL